MRAPTCGFLAGTLASLASLVVLPLAAGGAVKPSGAKASSDNGCARPRAVYDYDPRAMAYRMELDLSGCSWWRGGEIMLIASLTRSDGLSEGLQGKRARSFTVCWATVAGDACAS